MRTSLKNNVREGLKNTLWSVLDRNHRTQKTDALQAAGWFSASSYGPDAWLNPRTMITYKDVDSAFEALSLHYLTPSRVKSLVEADKAEYDAKMKEIEECSEDLLR